MSLPSFSDKAFWDEQLQNYIDCGARTQWLNGEEWKYFKHCLRTRNRFFFQNPLIPVIISGFEQNTYVLNANTSVYRARIDKERECENQCWLAKDLQELLEAEETEQNSGLKASIVRYYKSKAEAAEKNPEYQKFIARKASGFEGFDANGSGVAPFDKATSGRCNPQNVSYLYTSNDPHTAVAEVRPFIRDSISVATLQPKRNLRLVDFYY